jgi:hypothetical protein
MVHTNALEDEEGRSMNEGSRNAAHIDDLKQQLASLVTQARKLLGIINDLEDLDGVPKTELPDLVVGSVSQGKTSTNSGATSFLPASRSLASIRPDEYLGQRPIDAAKSYLASVGRATHLDEIADAVQRGGAAIFGALWKDQLDSSLLRSTADIVKIQDQVYGLVRFYSEEQLAGLRATRRQRPEEKPKRKGKGKRGRKSKKQVGVDAAKAFKPKPDPVLGPEQADKEKPKKE